MRFIMWYYKTALIASLNGMRFSMTSYKKALIASLITTALIFFAITAIEVAYTYGQWEEAQAEYSNQLARKDRHAHGILHERGICTRHENSQLTIEDIEFVKSELKQIEKASGPERVRACAGIFSEFNFESSHYISNEWLWALEDRVWQSQDVLNGPQGLSARRDSAIECTTGCVKLLSNAKNPGGLLNYALHNRIRDILFISIAIAASFFGIFVTSKVYFQEPHIGWKRLTIVVAIIMAFVVPVIYANYSYDSPFPEVFLIFFGTLIGSTAAMILGRKLYLWIKAGFHDHPSISPLVESNVLRKQSKAKIQHIPQKELGQELDTSPKCTTESLKNQNKKGVAGWLSLLIFGYFILGSMSSLGNMSNEFITAVENFPHLANSAKWQNYKSLSFALFTATSAISIIAGIRLLKIHQRASVRFAIFALWITGPLSMALFTAATIFILDTDVHNKGVVGMIGQIIFSVIAAVIWTAYLKLSVRVKNTYN